MSTVILHGEEAIHFAEAHHLNINCTADDGYPESHDLSAERARAIAQEHPKLVWIEIDWAVNTAEPRH